MGRVVIGMDPHKRSATIEVLDGREQVLGGGRYGTDRDGYQQMLAADRRWKDRVWAVEGWGGVGRPLAQRLVADGETVVDVPAKLSARARVFSTGNGRKTDATDAHPRPPQDKTLTRTTRLVVIPVTSRCAASSYESSQRRATGARPITSRHRQ